MPKDNVNDMVNRDLRAEVAWSPSGYVQVGTTSASSPFRFDPEPGAAEGEPFTGWFATLDREGCNRLIRSVRKARDAAYGVDA